MTSSGIYTLANDAVYDPVIPFINRIDVNLGQNIAILAGFVPSPLAPLPFWATNPWGPPRSSTTTPHDRYSDPQ
jgi:hypothetical protein